MRSFTATDPQSHKGQTNSWLTPLWLIDALGKFDLDPCAYPGHKTARKMWYGPGHIDGLNRKWNGRVWLNPPYGAVEVVHWLDRMADHQNGIALVFARTSNKWFHDLWCEKFFIKGRITFERPPGSKEDSTNAGTGSMLLAWTDKECQAIDRSGIEGSWG